MMYMKTNYILLFGIAIALLFVISLWDCRRVKPYSAPTAFSVYEGMEEDEGFDDDDNNEDKEDFQTMASSDIFSDSPSSLSCSSGLSNTGGGLCLSKDQQMMLRTRGGNASTGEAKIGN